MIGTSSSGAAGVSGQLLMGTGDSRSGNSGKIMIATGAADKDKG